MAGIVIEWAPFTLRAGVTEAALLDASARLQAEFLDRQEGFVRRELVQRADGEYVDVVWWRSAAAARQAMTHAANSPSCGAYFAIMDTNGDGAGDGVEHFRSVNTYGPTP